MKKAALLSVTLLSFLLTLATPAFAAESALPATGGMGTKVFIVVGIALMLGAVIFIIVRQTKK